MRTALRILAAVVGLVVVAIIAAVIILPLVIDPNDYRERIAREVEARTGRTLTLRGPIELSVFPWLGLSLEDAALGNAAGFGDEPFIAVQEARVKARALPLLLRRDLEVDTVVLRAPRIHLAVDRQGRGNWEGLLGEAAEPEQDQPDTQEDRDGGIGQVVLGGVEISAGELSYEDRRSGAVTRVRDLDLEVGRLAPGESVPVKLDAIVEASGPGITADVRLEAQLDADPQAKRYALSELAAAALLEGEGLPKDGLPVALTGEAVADLAAGTARVPQLRLAVLEAVLTGSGELSSLDAQPVFTGTLELAPFSPRELMETLGIEVETADADALGNAQARLAVRAGADALELRELEARLDETTATGTLSVAGFDAPRVRFDLQVDRFDLDRYLAPGATEVPQARGGGEPREPAPAPAQPGLRLDELGARLAAVDVSGQLAIGSLEAARLRARDVTLTLRGKDGAVQLEPLRAALYEGTLEGALGFDARPAQPVVTARQSLTGVALAPLLEDLGQRPFIAGRADLTLDLRASGQVAAELARTLDGTLRAEVSDGVLQGINIDRAICLARAAVDTARGEERETCDPSPDSRFETLRVSGTFTDGVLRSDDLLIVQRRYEAGEFYQVSGAGTVNLARQELDWQLRAVRTRERDGQATPEEKGRAIPVRISGTFDHLSVRPDTRALVEGETKEQLREHLGDELETEEDDSELERQGKELLKGLLGR